MPLTISLSVSVGVNYIADERLIGISLSTYVTVIYDRLSLTICLIHCNLIKGLLEAGIMTNVVFEAMLNISLAFGLGYPF